MFPISFGIKVDENWVFGVKIRTFRQRAVFARLQLATASYTVTTPHISRSCVFFAYFCFELAFGVHMKVLDN